LCRSAVVTIMRVQFGFKCKGGFMPLLKLEYTDNLVLKPGQLSAFFVGLHHLVAEQVNADVSACKSRSVVLQDYVVGDGGECPGYVLLTIQVLSGRPVEQRVALKSLVTDYLSDFFQSNTVERPAVRVYVTELESEFYGMA
jgi:5-carboxymethyl-2-hydroxymuconate isomerase